MKTHFHLHSHDNYISTFDDFARHLESYTDRILSHQSDILNAFQGILTSLYAGDMGLYGLPEADFDRALLWRCIEEHKNGPVLNETWFPSWSWASSNKKAKASRSYNQKFVVALVRWAYKDRNGELQPIKPINRPKPQQGYYANEHTTPQICLLVAWWKGYVEAAIPETLQRMLQGHDTECKPGIVHLLPRLEDVWQAIRGSRKDVLEEDQDLSVGLKEEDQGLIDRLRSGLLLTRAQTAMFDVSKDKAIFILEDYRMGIDNSKSKIVGSVGTELEVRNIKLNSKRRGGLCELMGISLSTDGVDEINFDLPADDSESHKPYETPGIIEKTGPLPPLIVNVLLIDWSESLSFARRVGIGRIYLEAWRQAQRIFKTIILE